MNSPNKPTWGNGNQKKDKRGYVVSQRTGRKKAGREDISELSVELTIRRRKRK